MPKQTLVCGNCFYDKVRGLLRKMVNEKKVMGFIDATCVGSIGQGFIDATCVGFIDATCVGFIDATCVGFI